MVEPEESKLPFWAARAAVTSAALATIGALTCDRALTFAFVGLLALPCGALEEALGRQPRRLTLLVLPLVWIGLSLAVMVAHGQAVYAAGVFGAGTLTGGLAALASEPARLASRMPGELDLRPIDLESFAAATLATAFTLSTLAPAAARGRRAAGEVPPHEPYERAADGVLVYFLAQGLAVSFVTVVVGAPPLAMIYLIFMLGLASLPACAVVVLARFVADALVTAQRRRITSSRAGMRPGESSRGDESVAAKPSAEARTR